MKTLYYASDIARLLHDVVRAFFFFFRGTGNWAEVAQNDIGKREEATEDTTTNLIFWDKLKTHWYTHTSSRTMFMSMPLVYVQACWKYSSSLCLSGFGIWWKRMNSLTRSIWRWYLAVPEYNLWMMADTFPKMLAYIRAGREARQVTDEAWRLRLLMQSTYQINHCCCLCVRVFSGKDLPRGFHAMGSH